MAPDGRADYRSGRAWALLTYLDAELKRWSLHEIVANIPVTEQPHLLDQFLALDIAEKSVCNVPAALFGHGRLPTVNFVPSKSLPASVRNWSGLGRHSQHDAVGGCERRIDRVTAGTVTNKARF